MVFLRFPRAKREPRQAESLPLENDPAEGGHVPQRPGPRLGLRQGALIRSKREALQSMFQLSLKGFGLVVRLF